MGPTARSTRPTLPSTEARSAMSAGMAGTRPPRSWISATVSASCLVVRAHTATAAPTARQQRNLPVQPNLTARIARRCHGRLPFSDRAVPAARRVASMLRGMFGGSTATPAHLPACSPVLFPTAGLQARATTRHGRANVAASRPRWIARRPSRRRSWSGRTGHSPAWMEAALGNTGRPSRSLVVFMARIVPHVAAQQHRRAVSSAWHRTTRPAAPPGGSFRERTPALPSPGCHDAAYQSFLFVLRAMRPCRAVQIGLRGGSLDGHALIRTCIVVPAQASGPRPVASER